MGISPRRARSLPITLYRTRVGFLYGDAGLDQPAVAKLLGVPQAAIARAVKSDGLRAKKPLYGEWNRAAFELFAKGFSESEVRPALPADIPRDRLWLEIRKILRREVPRLIANVEDGVRWLDAFVTDLLRILAEAQTRLTRPRLEFLYGDLRVHERDIAEIFDSPLPMVLRVVRDHGIEPWGPYFGAGAGFCAEFAKAVGLSDWDFIPVPGDSDMNAIQRQKVAFRRFLVARAKAGGINWHAADVFLAADRLRELSAKAGP